MEDFAQHWPVGGEEPADGALVAEALEHDCAFDALYCRYLPRVYRYLRTYTESDEDAADLTQHVFLRVYEALPRYRPGSAPFSAWLFRIARNAATDAFRRRRRALPWDHIPEAWHPFSAADPEAHSLQRERLNDLRVAVGRLDDEKQELLALRFAAGLTSAEIAALVGRSEGAVKRQLSRILQVLREHYDDGDR
jgi:RNA polymerase sigma-70 factor (ECF subfamily)